MSEERRVRGAYHQQLAKVRVSRLATRQSGVVARRQLLLLDVSETQIREWTTGGYLFRRLRGVYSVGYPRTSADAELTAALLYAGPGAMLTGAVGAWWLGLRDHQPDVIEVATPRRRGSLPGLVVRGRCDLTRIWHRQLPVAPVADVLFEYARAASHAELVRALAQTEYHGYLDLDVLATLLRQGKPGSRALRAALASHDPRLARVRSPLEIDFLELCAKFAIPAPEVNVKVAGIEVDMLWRAQHVVVELDGGGNHRTAAQMHRDRESDLRVRRAGYVVQRYSRPQVRHRSDEVADDVLRALRRAA